MHRHDAGPFADNPTLEGALVVLRPFSSSDIDAMGPILADPEVLRLTGSMESTAEIEQATPELDPAAREWYESRDTQTDRIDLAIVDRATDGCVGEIVLNEWRESEHRANLRLLLGPGARDRGLGSEAIELLVGWAFGSTDLRRIELEVYAFNPRARHVYEKAGFRVEHVRENAFVFDGQPVAAIVMSRTRPAP